MTPGSSLPDDDHRGATPARRRTRLTLLLVTAVAILLAGTAATSGAQPAPGNALATDAAQYLPGSQVTVTGSGWTCSADGFSVSVTLKQGTTLIDSQFPTVTAGSFTQTFTAPATLGAYAVEAADQACGTTTVSFDVVAALPTTTTASTTTTTTTTTTTVATSTTAAPVSTVAPSTTAAVLPETGTSSSGIGLAGAVLLAIGIGFIVLTRRRAGA